MGNKYSIKKRICIPIALVISIVMFGGCKHLNKIKEIYEIPPIMEIPGETIHEINVIELEEADETETVESKIPAQELSEITLSLEECRALALQNNLELRVELIEPTINKEGIKQAEAKFEPSFSGDSIYSKVDTPTSSSLTPSKSESLSNNLGVNMPLRTGGTLSFDLVDYYYKSDLTYYDDPESYSTDLSVSISHPLLKNAGKNASTYSIRVAQYNSRAADLRTKIAAIRIIAAVDKAYWNLYASRRMLEVRNQQYDYATTTYEETKRFVEVGAKAKIEVIRTEKKMADAATTIITAENDVRQRERELKRMINKKGLGMETKTIIIPSSPPAPVRYDLNRESLIKYALENRMEMLELELQLAKDSMDIEYNRNQLLPDITLGYKYNINGLSTEKRGDSYDMLFDNDHNDHRVTLSMTMPLGNKKAKSQLRQSIYERAQRLITKEDKEAEIKSDVLNQIDNLDAAWQSILASRQNTLLSDEQYRAEKRQYELGLVNSTELLKAQTELAEAQRAEIAAITDYQIGLINLAYASGMLLGEAKIEWEPVVPAD